MSSSSSTGSTNPRRRRRYEGGIVNLRFNPTNDAILSLFISGSIFPCVLPSIPPGPFPAPTPSPMGATTFMNCLLENGFQITFMGVLTATDVLVTLVREY